VRSVVGLRAALGLGLVVVVGLAACSSPIPTVAPSPTPTFGTIDAPSGPPEETLPAATAAATVVGLDAVNAVAMLTPEQWLIAGGLGPDAAVARTTDGGESWTVTTLAGERAMALAVLPPFDAWANVPCAPGPLAGAMACVDVIYQSTDGGLTWLDQQWSTQVFDEISFGDAKHGWATPGGEVEQEDAQILFGTPDGGHGWIELHPCPEGWRVAGIARVSAAEGWVACADQPGAGSEPKAIRRTEDDGQTWRTMAMNNPPGGVLTGSLPISGYVSGIAARPGGRMWMWSDRGVLMGSDSGGFGWTPLPLGNPDVATILSASFADDVNGLALVWDAEAGSTLLERSSDGGASWTIVARLPLAP
jgi:photosystem II stability/assembly factor-like uncharacterized protein